MYLNDSSSGIGENGTGKHNDRFLEVWYKMDGWGQKPSEKIGLHVQNSKEDVKNLFLLII